MAKTKTKSVSKITPEIVEKLINELEPKTQTPEVDNTQSCPFQPPDMLQAVDCFPTLLYKINKPEFLEDVRKVANANLKKMKKKKKIDEIYPVVMSEHLDGIPGIMPFANWVAQTSWNILDQQGYDVMPYRTYFTELWCQEHHKHSLMEEHIHPYGVHIVGMYFIEVPENPPRLLVHDPRPGKAVLNLPQKDHSQLTPGSVMVNFEPEVGDVFFAPAWLAHSFGRHSGTKPFKFIHFNVGLKAVQQDYTPETNDPNSPTASTAVNKSAPEII